MNIEALKYIKQLLTNIKGDIDSSTIIVRNFNTPLTSRIDHTDRKSVRKHWFYLRNDGLKRYIYNILSQSSRKKTFFSKARKTFSRIGHVVGHKISLSKFKKIVIAFFPTTML